MNQQIAIFRFTPNGPPDEAMLATIEKLSNELRAIPGFRSHADFFNNNGEVLTFVEFDSLEALRAWREHPLHRQAKSNARQTMHAWQVWIGSVTECYGSRDFELRQSLADQSCATEGNSDG